MGLIDVQVEPSYKAREDGSKMKALAWYGSNDVRMIQVPVPDITQPVSRFHFTFLSLCELDEIG
jgi:hypothetical protein